MEVLERHFIQMFLIGAGREREELGKVRKYKLQKLKTQTNLWLRKKLGKSTHARQGGKLFQKFSSERFHKLYQWFFRMIKNFRKIFFIFLVRVTSLFHLAHHLLAHCFRVSPL